MLFYVAMCCTTSRSDEPTRAEAAIAQRPRLAAHAELKCREGSEHAATWYNMPRRMEQHAATR